MGYGANFRYSVENYRPVVNVIKYLVLVISFSTFSVFLETFLTQLPVNLSIFACYCN